MADVRAAGAVVIRPGKDEPEVLVIHRPRYDDWSLPKGKLDDGETYEQAAVRELLEETGVTVELERFLTETRYDDHKGRDKVVRWWRARPLESRPRPADEEVDEVRWVPLSQLTQLLTYGDDFRLVEAAVTEEMAMTILLVRHAEAGDRSTWDDPDHLRPLSERGAHQAARLVEQLRPWQVDRIVTSPYVRCVQTVEPLAAHLGLDVEQDERLAEGSSPQASDSLLLDSKGTVTVWCSHGDVIGDLVTRLHRDGVADQRRWSKGSTWVLERARDGRITSARYLDPPA